MRESFIAQYLEQQRIEKEDERQKTQSHRQQVASWKSRNPNPRSVVKQEKPARQKEKKQKRRHKQNRCLTPLGQMIGSLLKKKWITSSTKFNDALRMLWFDSYKSYLSSKLWRLVKEHVFQTCGRQCVLCRKVAETVHHRAYTSLSLIGKDIPNLMPVCNPSHQMIEFDVDGTKLRSAEVEQYVKEHLRQNELREDAVSREFRNMFL